MDEIPFELDERARDIQARARTFTEDVLIPLEEEAESRHGRLPEDVVEDVKRAAVDAGLVGGLHRPEYGGQGWSRLEWALVEEQWGRSTNAIHWHVPNAYNVWHHASEAQVQRWLVPALRGEVRDAYAVTERDAGSDPSRIATVAEPTGDGYRINGEKWFVTTGDVAAVYIVMANVIADGAKLPTLFVVDRNAPGVEIVDDPAFTHSYPDGHPTIVFRDVEVTEADAIGGIGGGDDLQRAWFMEERLGIAARCIGAMWRLLDETVAWAASREQGGNRIIDYQGVSFPLADSAADAAAGRLLTLTVAELADRGADLKVVHGKASMAKLFTSEAAWRCADRCVQAFGGRGYLRSNVTERFLRELRVDRIWEGTSEIQRLVTVRGLERRGVERMLH
ncbi:MAG TPA: acyl-CoA dehydrogenase family protein [Solirubrobacterales bacterium]|jgi:alkylation response protein AidB-like acyl-CoA dehydrogenase|nr:acyl-CoA dehydrogenase family protein [Solirubrobacterales bacterium]